jgi:hypothetical protein
MGLCCSNLQFEIEEEIRDIILQLKITKFTKKDFDEFAKKNVNKINSKEKLKEIFSEIFYEKDPSINPNHKIHKGIFEDLMSNSNKNIKVENINGIGLFVFPLLKNSNQKNHIEFIECLKNYSGEFYSYERIRSFLIYLYEFYTIGINKVFIIEGKSNEMKNISLEMNKLLFNYDRILDLVERYISSLESHKNTNYSINTDHLLEVFEKYDIFKFIEIREELI